MMSVEIDNNNFISVHCSGFYPHMKLDKIAEEAAHQVNQLSDECYWKGQRFYSDSTSSVSNNFDCFQTQLTDVTVIGLHKRNHPKTSYFYIFLVTWKDGSHVTLYRKSKDIKNFQAKLNEEISIRDDQREALHYLSKMKRKTTLSMMTSLMGTMRRLHTIDKINLYFQALTYYFKDVSELSALTNFFELTNDDVNLRQKSNFGKTYFYVSRSIINRRDVIIKNHDIQNYTQDLNEKDCKTCSNRLMSSNDDVIYKATKDYHPSETDLRQNIIELRTGDEVQILSKSETGWWFVQRLHDTELSGYVPASFLQKSSLQSTMKSSKSCHNLNNLQLNFDKSAHNRSKDFCKSMTSLNSFSLQRRTSSFSSVKSTERFYYVTTRDYSSQNPDEMSFEKGDVLQIIQKRLDGWWTARRGREEGLVPAVHLTAAVNDPIRSLSSKIYAIKSV